MKAVTIDQLRVFRQVAETGSFSAAARAMHRAQSAVTYAVQKLEAQVGVDLFDRGGYRPVLSEAGRALLPRAVRLPGALANIAGKIQPDQLRDHVQLVLADRSKLTEGRDFSVFALRTWRLADLGARHEMLLAGLGWGSMPVHMVEDDLAAGRLVRLDI